QGMSSDCQHLRRWRARHGSNVRKLRCTDLARPLYPQKADMCVATRDVRFGPEADMCSARPVSAKGQRRKSFQGSRYRILIIAAVGAASGLIQISSARPSRPLRAQRRDLRHRSAVCAGPQQSVCGKLFVMERSESNFLFRAYVFANASAASEAIIVRRLGNLAMGSVQYRGRGAEKDLTS